MDKVVVLVVVVAVVVKDGAGPVAAAGLVVVAVVVESVAAAVVSVGTTGGGSVMVKIPKNYRDRIKAEDEPGFAIRTRTTAEPRGLWIGRRKKIHGKRGHIT